MRFAAVLFVGSLFLVPLVLAALAVVLGRWWPAWTMIAFCTAVTTWMYLADEGTAEIAPGAWAFLYFMALWAVVPAGLLLGVLVRALRRPRRHGADAEGAGGATSATSTR